MPIEVPSWLQPADVVGDFQRGLATGTQVAEAQARLSQQAQETSMRANVAAQEAQREHDLAQQRIAVSQAYQQQQIDLRKQQLAEVKSVNDQKTANAARQYAARQQWQQMASQIDADTTLTPEQKDDAKSKAIMRLAPQMGTAGTEAAAMMRDLRPVKPTVPASVQDKGDYYLATQPNGNITVHPKPKPVKEDKVKVKLDASTLADMTQSQALATIQGLPKEIQDDPVNAAVVAGAYTSDVAKRQAAIFGAGNSKPKKFRFDHDKGLIPADGGQ